MKNEAKKKLTIAAEKNHARLIGRIRNTIVPVMLSFRVALG